MEQLLNRIIKVTRGCHNSLHSGLLKHFCEVISFVAGKENFCSHLLASLVHFTVVKSQAVLIIRLGVAEVISTVTLYLLPASKHVKTTKFLPRWICSGTTILRVDSAYRSSLWQQRCVCLM